MTDHPQPDPTASQQNQLENPYFRIDLEDLASEIIAARNNPNFQVTKKTLAVTVTDLETGIRAMHAYRDPAREWLMSGSVIQYMADSVSKWLQQIDQS